MFVMFYFIMLKNQIASYNAMHIFENLTMTWVENFWSYNAKVIEY